MAKVVIEFVGDLPGILSALYVKRQSDAEADALLRNKNQSVRVGDNEIQVKRNDSSDPVRLSPDTEVVFYRDPKRGEAGTICTFLTYDMGVQINVMQSHGRLEVITKVLSHLPTTGWRSPTTSHSFNG